jgi:hypothetical protein
MRELMKLKILSVTFLVCTLAALTTLGFAAEKASLRLAQTVDVGGKTLSDGSYTVTWEGNGPNVELQFLKGKKVIASVPAQVVTLEKATSTNSVVTHDEGNGKTTLTQILLSGKKFAFHIGASTEQTTSLK